MFDTKKQPSAIESLMRGQDDTVTSSRSTGFVKSISDILKKLNEEDRYVVYSYTVLPTETTTYTMVVVSASNRKLNDTIDSKPVVLSAGQMTEEFVLVNAESVDGSTAHLTGSDIVTLLSNGNQGVRPTPFTLQLPSNSALNVLPVDKRILSVSNDEGLITSALMQLRVTILANIRRSIGLRPMPVASSARITPDGIEFTLTTSASRAGSVVINDKAAQSSIIGSIKMTIDLAGLKEDMMQANVANQTLLTPIITVTNLDVSNDVYGDIILSSVLFAKNNYIQILAKMIEIKPELASIYGLAISANTSALSSLYKRLMYTDGTGAKRLPAANTRIIINPDDTNIFHTNLINTIKKNLKVDENGSNVYPAGTKGKLSLKTMGPTQFYKLLSRTQKRGALSPLVIFNSEFANRSFIDKVVFLNNHLDETGGTKLRITGIAKEYSLDGEKTMKALTNASENLQSPSGILTDFAVDVKYNNVRDNHGW